MARVMIFSPYLKPRTWQEMGYIILDYLKKNFKEYSKELKEVEIQKFSSTVEPVRVKANKIGAGREIFIIFDQRLKRENPSTIWTPKQRTYNLSTHEQEFRIKLKNESFDMTQKLCNEQGIPYIIYKGEIEKGERDILIRNLNGIEKLVLYRLEKLRG